MKFLAFSDLHAHPFKQFSTVDKNGINSRLMHSLQVLQKIRKYAVKRGIPTVLFGGDLFHKRDFIDVQTFNLVYNELAKMKSDGLEVVVLIGNHDMVSRSGNTNSLWTMRHIVKVITEPKVITVAGGKVYCLPYTKDPILAKQRLSELADHAKENPGFKVLLAHTGISGAVVGALEYALPGEEVSTKDLGFSRYDLVLLGHYHKRQALADNVMYIGSPIQHDFNDRSDEEKGFLEVDLADNLVKHIPTNMPEFRVVECGSKAPAIDPQHFYKILVNKKSKLEMVEHLLSPTCVVELQELEESVSRSELSLDMSDSELVRSFVDTEAPADISKDELIHVGMTLLSEAVQ